MNDSILNFQLITDYKKKYPGLLEILLESQAEFLDQENGGDTNDPWNRKSIGVQGHWAQGACADRKLVERLVQSLRLILKKKKQKKKRNSVNFRNLFGSDPILRNAIMYFILYFINSVIYYLFTFYFWTMPQEVVALYVNKSFCIGA